MHWMKKEEVEAASLGSDIEIVDCCIKHWKQLYCAGPHDLRYAQEHRLVSVFSNYCAACKRYGPLNCGLCPVNCIDFWWGASKSFCLWMKSNNDNDWRNWEQASLRMLEHLQKVREKL